MTIFHVLKHPVSCPPTWDELQTIPTPVRTLIMSELFTKQPNGDYTYTHEELRKKLLGYLMVYEDPLPPMTLASVSIQDLMR